MQELTRSGDQAVQNLAQRYGVSADAVRTLLFAVSAGGGTMAQFYHPDLGGGGQWMRGGMTMVGDMFNSGLQATVSGLCSELSSLLASQTLIARPSGPAGGIGSAGNAFWPAHLGNPSSSGGQNDSRYAIFPHAQRLAVERAGQVTIYDTLDHQIGGVQQQQGGAYGSFTFSSQRGTFSVDSLPVVSPASAPQNASNPPPSAASFSAPPPPTQSSGYVEPAPSQAPFDDWSQAGILAAIERLGELQQKGILSDEEFRSKKAELLARL